MNAFVGLPLLEQAFLQENHVDNKEQ